MHACSVTSDSLWPYRLLYLWDSPGRILEWVAMPSSMGGCPALQADSLPLSHQRSPLDIYNNSYYMRLIKKKELMTDSISHSRILLLQLLPDIWEDWPRQWARKMLSSSPFTSTSKSQLSTKQPGPTRKDLLQLKTWRRHYNEMGRRGRHAL